jgi:nucleolar protein 4
MTSEPKQGKKANFKKNMANTVFFRYTPADISITRKTFESLFSDVGPVKKCSLIRQRRSETENNQREAKGYGFCKFTNQEDAVSAANSLNETDMDWEYGRKIKVWVELADEANKNKKKEEKVATKNIVPEGTPAESDAMETTDEILALQSKKRTSRVILRNLSFYATEHNIRQVMEQKFGEVVDINLPMVPTPNAPTGQRKRMQHRGFAFVTFANQNSAHKAVDACAGDEQILIKKRPVAIDFSVSKFQHKRMQEEEKGNEEKEETVSDNESTSSDGSGDSDGSSSSSDDDSGSDSDSDSESDEEMEEDDAKETEKKIPENSHQHSLFLRNLPFDATRHDLFTLFSQYGHIAGIFLVRDRDTGIGKGTAFVKFSKEGGCLRALEASNGADADGFKTGKSIGEDGHSGGGLYLNGRRLFVDLAVDKGTADSLKVERDEDGKPIEKKNIGKDRRNLYLKGEGRVENNEDEDHNPDAWENLPQSDQLKRGRAHQEKSTKLRSPLFFINPLRLSIRNLAKHIDETQLKNLMARGIENGLKNGLVTKDDIIAHWRSSGEMDARAIMEKVAISEKEGGIIPPFDAKKVKSYIPSVFIDRDFQATMKQSGESKGERLVAPSRGFGFAEFTHHAHAMACLREINNNRQYTAEFVAGGKRAMEMKKQRIKRRKKATPDIESEDGPSGADFVGDDGKIRIPRLIVEFTVENKAKARKQAENKAQQLENARKQKIAAKAKAAEASDGKKFVKKKKGRGAQQRAKKRRMIAEGLLDKDGNKIEDKDEKNSKKQKLEKSEEPPARKPKEKAKALKPPKKNKKLDKEEEKFKDMVQSYKKAFSGASETKKKEEKVSDPRAEITNTRWFD